MTEAQINANRENAKKSTGPRTPEGKAASSRNGLKHGLTAGAHILPGEDPEEFLHLLKDLYDRFHPVGDSEEKLVQRIAAAQWRLDRVFPMEAAIFRDSLRDVAMQDENSQVIYERQKKTAERSGQPLPPPPIRSSEADALGRAFIVDCVPNALTKLTRYETTIERSIDRCLHQLKAFQAARRIPGPDAPVVGPPVPPAETVPPPPSSPSETLDCKANPIQANPINEGTAAAPDPGQPGTKHPSQPAAHDQSPGPRFPAPGPAVRSVTDAPQFGSHNFRII